MARILIGNIKGPQGEQGPQGIQGPVGPQGPKGDTGPMPTLINNGTTTQASVGALDAAYGKTLTDKDTDLQNQLTTLNGNIPPIFIDTTRVLYDKSGAGTILSYTATEDCYAAIWAYASIDATATLDDATLFITASSGGVYSGAWSGFIKKGSVLKSSNPCRAIIYGLKS